MPRLRNARSSAFELCSSSTASRPGTARVLVGVPPLQAAAAERRLDADLLALPRRAGDLTGVQQGFRGDAAGVRAGPAEFVLLDKRARQAEPRRAQRWGVSAAAPA